MLRSILYSGLGVTSSPASCAFARRKQQRGQTQLTFHSTGMSHRHTSAVYSFLQHQLSKLNDALFMHLTTRRIIRATVLFQLIFRYIFLKATFKYIHFIRIKKKSGHFS